MDLNSAGVQGRRKRCLRVSREVLSWDLGKDVLPSTSAAFSNGFCGSGDKNMVCPLELQQLSCCRSLKMC